jgi:hypothetical protein
LNTKVAPKIMLINSRLSKIVIKPFLPLLASNCNNYSLNNCFSHFKFNGLILHVMINMYVMIMLMLSMIMHA